MLSPRQFLNLTTAAGILASGLWLASRPAQATPEYTEKEKKACDFCHPGGDLFALNDAGQYYAEHHSLEGFPDPDQKNTPPAKPEPPKPEPAKPQPANP